MMNNLALLARIGLYFAGGWLANQGYASFDQAAGTITLQIEPLSEVVGGLLVAGGTFAMSRVVKAKGGHT